VLLQPADDLADAAELLALRLRQLLQQPLGGAADDDLGGWCMTSPGSARWRSPAPASRTARSPALPFQNLSRQAPNRRTRFSWIELMSLAKSPPAMAEPTTAPAMASFPGCAPMAAPAIVPAAATPSSE